MKNRWNKKLTFFGIIMFLLTFHAPVSAWAGSEDYRYEEDYVFYTESGAVISLEILRIENPEEFCFKEYSYSNYSDGDVNTYAFYKQGSEKEPYSLGYEDLVFVGDDVYLMKNGVCRNNTFFYLGKDTAGCTYWMYFGADGKMVRNAMIHGLFWVDENGLFDFHRSDLYKRSAEKDGSEDEFKYYYDDITKVLNRIYCSMLGQWVKIEDHVDYPKYTVKGQFVEDAKGLRYLAETLYVCEEISPHNNILELNKLMRGYVYQADPMYDRINTLSVENDYLRDIYIQLGDDFYYFDEEGYAVTNKWVFVEEDVWDDLYFGDTGKKVTDSWVARDGELYLLDENGGICTNEWITLADNKVYLGELGEITYSAREEEQEIQNKLKEFQKLYPEGTKVGICSTFANMVTNYLFGNNAKGKNYAYNWDSIKSGDTISGTADEFSAPWAGHIAVVMYKDRNSLLLAESNEDDDRATHYYRVFSREYFDKLQASGKMPLTFTTYYDAAVSDKAVFTPQATTLSVQNKENTVTFTLGKSERAVGYCIYMANSIDGEYKEFADIPAENGLNYRKDIYSSGMYYFKTRAYLSINGEKLWSDYSNIASCKIDRVAVTPCPTPSPTPTVSPDRLAVGYDLNDDMTALVYGTASCVGERVIPEEIDGYPVTEIDVMGFSMCEMTGITIPGSVKVINNAAFNQCNELEYVIVSEGVTCIKNEVFSACEKLKKVVLPASITYMGGGVFACCPEDLKIYVPRGSYVAEWAKKYYPEYVRYLEE